MATRNDKRSSNLVLIINLKPYVDDLTEKYKAVNIICFWHFFPIINFHQFSYKPASHFKSFSNLLCLQESIHLL